MEKKKNVQLVVIAVLAFAILFMSVGFATYSSTLNIEGNVSVAASKWSVHFVDNSYVESSGSKAATSHTLSNTALQYAVTLDKPGDFYECTLNVINDGTFDATLTGITLSSLTAAQSKYLTYKITYDGVEYSATNSSLSLSLPHATGSNTKVVKVRVDYVQPANSADLPATAVDVTLTASLDYEQAA